MATTVVGELPTALDRLAAPCRSCAPNLEPTKTRLVPLWAWLPLQEDPNQSQSSVVLRQCLKKILDWNGKEKNAASYWKPQPTRRPIV